MNTKELNILAKQHLWPHVKEANYYVLKSNVSGYEFKKELNGNFLNCFGGTYIRPAGLAITSPAFYITVPKFNAVINHYFEKFNVEDHEDSFFCDASSTGRKFELGGFMTDFGISSEEDFFVWLGYFKNYMAEIVEPFFESCTTMQGLNELVNTRKNDEDLRTSLGTSNAWMKKLFILKVAKSEKYSEYSEWYLSHNTILMTKEEGAWEKYCNACFALYDDLEKGVWDDFKL